MENLTQEEKNNYLCDAASKGNVREMELLVNMGADVNATVNGLTPLGYAITFGFENACRLLITLNADIAKEYGNEVILPPIAWAAEDARNSIIELMVFSGADVNQAGSVNGDTALMLAIADNRIETAWTLISMDADPLIKDSSGRDALYFAVGTQDVEFVERLLMKFKEGFLSQSLDSGLMHSIILGNSKMSKLLVDNGASIHSIDGLTGESVEDICIRKWKTKISDFILSD